MKFLKFAGKFLKKLKQFFKGHVFRAVGIAFILVFAAFFVWIIVITFAADLPNLNDFQERIIIQSTQIYDREGKTLLYDIHGEEKRTLIPFEEIPRSIKNATIAIEDDTFYQHNGFRPTAFLRAVFVNIMSGELEQGGSTITQQLIKNTFLTTEKKITRKIKEIILAIKIERIYSKEEILGLYLNQIPYGNSAYGVEAASKTFFDKNARDLTILESAYLAALPNAPSYYSPYGKQRDELDLRALQVLKNMRSLQLISEVEFDEAINSPIKFAKLSPTGIVAPHFVIEIRDILSKQFGEDIIERGGLKVITTLDASLQKHTEETIKSFAESNEKNFNANNASIVAIDPKTGDILAMVGSKDYFGDSQPIGCSPGVNCKFDPEVNVSLRQRQPGSAFKPFVYATAFKEGYTPDTVVFDVQTEFNPSCGPDGSLPTTTPILAEARENYCYHPVNFDDKFRGPITLRGALAQSLNVPSVKVLYLAGLEDSLKTAKDAGITSLTTPERYGLTLVLGGGEVSLLELASAYGVFASEGTRNEHRYILRIEDFSGNILFESLPNPIDVLDKNIARSINDILSDNTARAPSFGEYSALYFPGKQVAAKTGTTNDYRDAWIIGYTPSVVVGAWAGNNDNTPMEKKVAGFIVAPMWREVMQYLIDNNPDDKFSLPDKPATNKPILNGEWKGGVTYVIDKVSGKLATEYTPENTKEIRVVQSVHSILYWLKKNDPQGAIPDNPFKDPQFKNWETKVLEWALINGYLEESAENIPTEYDDIHTPDKLPAVTNILISPQKNTYFNDDNIIVTPVITSNYGVTQVDYINSSSNQYLGSSKQFPFSFSFSIERLTSQQDSGTVKKPITIKVYDSVGNQIEKTVYLNIII